MKTFGKLERDGAPTRLPALTGASRRNEPPAEQDETRDVSFAARTGHRAD